MGCGTCGAAIFAVVWDEPESSGAFIIAQDTGEDQETDAPGAAVYCRCGSFIWWEAAPEAEPDPTTHGA